MVVQLTPLDLVLAALLVVGLGASSWHLQLGLQRQLAVAALRTTLQLLLIGLVLKVLFDNAHWWWVSLMALVMLAVAGHEVMARQKRRFAGWRGYRVGISAMLVSSFSVTVLALLVVIGNEPWYKPQYAIPLLGMVLGNTMNGISLGMDRLTSGAWQQRAVIEARLMLGQDAQEALSDLRREAMRVGMIPMINSMAAAGVVSLPGMMTGQILAGTPPLEAVKYQILVMFLITAGTGFGTMLAVWRGGRCLFDERDRLRLERLVVTGQ